MRDVADALKIIMYAAVVADRLPRPPDEPKRRPLEGKRELLGWALTATLVVAGSSYWMGLQSLKDRLLGDQRAMSTGPTTSVPLPQPSAALPSHSELRSKRISSSEPIVAAPMPVVGAPIPKQNKSSLANEQIKSAEAATDIEAASSATIEKSPERTVTPNRIWPVQTIEGASGRLVRIGRFTTVSEAEKGWETVLRQHPGMQRLPSLPVTIKSLRDGRIYYRLQVGTTSQAHSNVVCQRMRDMDQSCTVIGSDEGNGENAI